MIPAMNRRALISALALATGACSSGPPLPDGFAASLDRAADSMPVRIHTSGDALASLAMPTDHRSVPADLRRTLEAIAPGGDVTYCARILGTEPGWLVEKSYPTDDGPAEPHTRSVRVRDDGSLIERTHQLPLAEVPRSVLRAALGIGNDVRHARVVQAEGEWFRLTVDNAFGWQHEVDVSADGDVLAVVRVKPAEIRATVQ